MLACMLVACIALLLLLLLSSIKSFRSLFSLVAVCIDASSACDLFVLPMHEIQILIKIVRI